MSDDLEWLDQMPTPPYGDLSIQQVFRGLGAELLRLQMMRARGGDPTADLEKLIDYIRRFVLGHMTKGVTLLDAARIMCSDDDGRVDEQAAIETRDRWQRIDREFYEHLPHPIGYAPEHRQVPLYEPSAILRLVEKFYGDERVADGRAYCRERRLAQRLAAVARYPRLLSDGIDWSIISGPKPSAGE